MLPVMHDPNILNIPAMEERMILDSIYLISYRSKVTMGALYSGKEVAWHMHPSPSITSPQSYKSHPVFGAVGRFSQKGGHFRSCTNPTS
jgi:hypothetical protein